jgi:hypothetical protein
MVLCGISCNIRENDLPELKVEKANNIDKSAFVLNEAKILRGWYSQGVIKYVFTL